MSQMMPINWIIWFIMFILICITLNIMNYYIFIMKKSILFFYFNFTKKKIENDN